MLELEALHLILHFVPLVQGLKLAVQGLALRGLALTIKFGEEGLHGIYRLPPLPPTPSPLFGEPFVAVQPVLF